MKIESDPETGAVYIETDGQEEIDPWVAIRLIADHAQMHVELAGATEDAIPE